MHIPCNSPIWSVPPDGLLHMHRAVQPLPYYKLKTFSSPQNVMSGPLAATFHYPQSPTLILTEKAGVLSILQTGKLKRKELNNWPNDTWLGRRVWARISLPPRGAYHLVHHWTSISGQKTGAPTFLGIDTHTLNPEGHCELCVCARACARTCWRACVDQWNKCLREMRRKADRAIIQMDRYH